MLFDKHLQIFIRIVLKLWIAFFHFACYYFGWKVLWISITVCVTSHTHIKGCLAFKREFIFKKKDTIQMHKFFELVKMRWTDFDIVKNHRNYKMLFNEHAQATICLSILQILKLLRLFAEETFKMNLRFSLVEIWPENRNFILKKKVFFFLMKRTKNQIESKPKN